jgi:putative transposase
MKFNNKYRSQSHRWQFWDYSAPGAYFITTVSHDRKPIFGYINTGEMILSDAGKIAKNHLANLNFNDLYIDQFVIMPNHIHLIMIIPDSIGMIPIPNFIEIGWKKMMKIH